MQPLILKDGRKLNPVNNTVYLDYKMKENQSSRESKLLVSDNVKQSSAENQAMKNPRNKAIKVLAVSSEAHESIGLEVGDTVVLKQTAQLVIGQVPVLDDKGDYIYDDTPKLGRATTDNDIQMQYIYSIEAYEIESIIKKTEEHSA